jgi:hypothetical protein
MTRNSVVIGILFSLIPTLLPAGTGPRIDFPFLEHDFGDVNQGQSPSVELTCANTGDETLILEKVESSCGCAKSVVGSPKIEPGSSGKIFAQVETRGMEAGRHSKTVHVFSNDPEHPRVTLKLIFNVVRHVSVNPDILATCLLGSGEQAVFSLQATNYSPRPVTLKVAKTDGAPEVILIPEEVTAPSGEKVNFQLSVRVKREPGQKNFKGEAIIETSDDVDKAIPLRYFIQLQKGASQWD